MKFKSVILLLIVTIAIGSCVKKENFEFNRLSKTTWNPEVAMPLMYSKLLAADVVAKTDPNVMNVGAGGLVTLIYAGESVSISADKLFTFPTPAPFGIDQLSITSAKIDTNFNLFDGASITPDRIIMSKGNLKVEFNITQLATSGEIIFRFKSFDPVIELKFPSNASSPPQTRALAGKVMVPAGGKFDLEIDMSSVVGFGTMEGLKVEITDPDYSRVEGDFKQSIFPLPKDSTQINLFKSVSEKGEFVLTNPSMELSYKNGFGIPMDLNLDSCYGILYNGETLPLNKKGSGSLLIKPATSSPKEDILSINSTNSNIIEFITPTPSWLVMQPLLQANPGSSGSKNNNFITKGAVCEMTTSMKMPLQGRVKFVVLDTVTLGLKEALDVIQNFSVKSNVINGFPLDATIQVMLLDKDYKPLLNSSGDTVKIISDQLLCKSGVIGPNIEVPIGGETKSSEDYEIKAEHVPYLKEAEFARIKAVLTTTDGQKEVKVLDRYTLEVSMGIKIKGNINLTK